MAHCNTILSQILKFVPRHEFETLARQYHSGRAFRKASRWSQFVSLTIAQLSGRNSLRDIVDNMSAQVHRLYHLGSAKLSRSSLSRINEDKPYALYEALFGKLLARCQSVAPDHKFKFSHPLYSLDASTIDLCLSAFPWADFRTTKGAIKLRRVGYIDAETGKHYVFLTNNFKLAAKTIADIYKARWQVELFFKWIKQNLKVKSFIGTSKNAVMTQIWVAMCVYLLIAFLKFQSKLTRSMQQILRLLQLNLFDKRDLMALLRGDPPPDSLPDINQIKLI